jgi:hypothetical protein
VPSDLVEQLALGVGSSVISGSAVWLAQRMRTSRGRSIRRRFLGLNRHGRTRCRIVVGRKYGSHNSIHEHDVAAALELDALLRTAGSEAEILSPTDAADAGADAVEFCLSGPDSNERTGAHLRRFLPTVAVMSYQEGEPLSLAYQVDGRQYVWEPGRAEYVLLARVCRPHRPHLFLISGQTGVTNRAGAAFLASHLPELRRRYGDTRSFGLILKVIDPRTFAHREVEEVDTIATP